MISCPRCRRRQRPSVRSDNQADNSSAAGPELRNKAVRHCNVGVQVSPSRKIAVDADLGGGVQCAIGLACETSRRLNSICAACISSVVLDWITGTARLFGGLLGFLLGFFVVRPRPPQRAIVLGLPQRAACCCLLALGLRRLGATLVLGLLQRGLLFCLLALGLRRLGATLVLGLHCNAAQHRLWRSASAALARRSSSARCCAGDTIGPRLFLALLRDLLKGLKRWAFSTSGDVGIA